MALNHCRRVASNRNAFDYIGISRSLREKLCLTGFVSRFIENFDKGATDNFALPFRIGDAAQL